MPMGSASLQYSPRPDTLGDGLRQLQRDSGGVVLLQIVRPPEAGALATLAAGGDTEAGQLLEAAMQIIDRVAAAPGREPVRCSGCGAAIRRMRFTCAVVLPFQAASTAGLGMAICFGCGTEISAIMDATQKAVRRILPLTRAIRPTHATGGRA